jgi:hypothetical protein
MKNKPQRPKDTNQLAKLIVDMSTGEKPKEPKPQPKKTTGKS